MHVVYLSVCLLASIFAVVLGDDEYGSAPPRISPYSPSNDVVVDAGATIRLKCDSSQRVTWKFSKDQDLQSRASVDATVITAATKRPFVATLTIPNASYTDTGFYYCMERKDNIQEYAQMNKIYVFVNDTDHLLLNSEEYDVVPVVENKMIVIPCKPTNPDVTVDLMRDSEEMELNDSNIAYDPKFGFTIKRASMKQHAGLYECTARYHNHEQSTFVEVLIFPVPPKIPKPFIRSSRRNPVPRGRNVTLECVVKMDSLVLFELSWRTPNGTSVKSDEVSVGNYIVDTEVVDGRMYKIATLPLQLYDISPSNEGNYVCIVRNHAQKKNAATYYLKVDSEDSNFIH